MPTVPVAELRSLMREVLTAAGAARGCGWGVDGCVQAETVDVPYTATTLPTIAPATVVERPAQSVGSRTSGARGRGQG